MKAIVLIFTFFVFYLLILPYLPTLGHTTTTHIKAMITGYEDVEDETPPAQAPQASMATTQAPA